MPHRAKMKPIISEANASSLLAASGAKGSENIIECEDGFLQAISEKSD